ncbi:MAG: hypothetical protein ACK2UW_08125 [Anaerolineales bacterium]
MNIAEADNRRADIVVDLIWSITPQNNIRQCGIIVPVIHAASAGISGVSADGRIQHTYGIGTVIQIPAN